MMGAEIVVGVLIYAVLVILLRAPVVYEARDLIIQKLRK